MFDEVKFSGVTDYYKEAEYIHTNFFCCRLFLFEGMEQAQIDFLVSYFPNTKG